MRGLASLRSEGGHLPAGMVVSMGQHDAQFQQHTQRAKWCSGSCKTRAFYRDNGGRTPKTTRV